MTTRTDPPASQPPPPPMHARPPAAGTVWPQALGAVSFAFASMGLLNLVGFVLQISTGLLTRRFGGGSGIGPFLGGLSAGPSWELMLAATLVLRPLLSGLLLAGGILLFWQRRRAALLHWLFAVPMAVLCVLSPVAQILIYPPHVRTMVFFGPIWGSTKALIYPTFLMIWFSRARVLRQMHAWR